MENLAFINGNIYTMNHRNPSASTMVFLGNRIFAIGDNIDVKSLPIPNKKIIDLEGKTVIPGLIDSHVHLLSYGLRFFSVDLSGIKSFEKVLRKIRKKVENTPPGEWITGGGWNKNLWEKDEFPSKTDLDKISRNHPILLHGRDGHSIWVNSLAFQEANITKNTPDPPDGKFVRDKNGELTGIVFEEARHSILDAIPPLAKDKKNRAIRKGIKSMQQFGLVGCHDMSSEKKYTPLGLLQEMNFGAGLPGQKFRINVSIQRDNLDDFIRAGIKTGFGNEYLRIGGLKILADGALGSQTAYMEEPYEGTDDYYGILDVEPDEIEYLVKKAWDAGISSTIHSIGDKCNSLVLNILDKLSAEFTLNPHSDHFQHRIEHVQCLNPRDIHYFTKLNLIASMQPIHIGADIRPAEKYWGERSKYAYIIKSLLDNNIRIAFGSDTPIETCDPIKNIYMAVTRKRLDGTPENGWNPQEKISVYDSIYAYTLGASQATGEVASKGSLEIGKFADAVVLSQDIFSVPEDEILNTEVLMTIIDGEIMYSKK